MNNSLTTEVQTDFHVQLAHACVAMLTIGAALARKWLHHLHRCYHISCLFSYYMSRYLVITPHKDLHMDS